MDRKPHAKTSSEILILPGGRVLAHNLTPALARVLAALNPNDRDMERRARPQKHLHHEFPH